MRDRCQLTIHHTQKSPLIYGIGVMCGLLTGGRAQHKERRQPIYVYRQHATPCPLLDDSSVLLAVEGVLQRVSTGTRERQAAHMQICRQKFNVVVVYTNTACDQTHDNT